MLPEFGPADDVAETTSGSRVVSSLSQARLFEAFLGLLDRLTKRSPTVLVIEDLHWADRSTLDLLTFLVRNLRTALLLVLTYRTDDLHRRHPVRPFLAELDRSEQVAGWMSIALIVTRSHSCCRAVWAAARQRIWWSRSFGAPVAMRFSPRNCSPPYASATPAPISRQAWKMCC